MKRITAAIAAAIALALAAWPGSPAVAGLFRAYLSVGGNDADPCTVQQPCRLLPRALSVVDDGGEIWILDSANFNTGTVYVSKSVSILVVPGALGSIVGTGSGAAMFVNAPGGEVALRQLKIRNLDTTQSGIVVGNAAKFIVDRCEIAGFSTADRSGLAVLAPTDTLVVDTLIRDNDIGLSFDYGAFANIVRTTVTGNAKGVYANPTAASTVNVSISDSVLSRNGSGVYAYSTVSDRIVRTTVVRSVASQSTYAGFTNRCYGSGSCRMTIEDSVANDNQWGFWNRDGTLIVSGSTATGNSDYGFYNLGSGAFLSSGNNTLAENGTADTYGTITPLPRK
jgi:hypothetical protein